MNASRGMMGGRGGIGPTVGGGTRGPKGRRARKGQVSWGGEMLRNSERCGYLGIIWTAIYDSGCASLQEQDVVSVPRCECI